MSAFSLTRIFRISLFTLICIVVSCSRDDGHPHEIAIDIEQDIKNASIVIGVGFSGQFVIYRQKGNSKSIDPEAILTYDQIKTVVSKDNNSELIVLELDKGVAPEDDEERKIFIDQLLSKFMNLTSRRILIISRFSNASLPIEVHADNGTGK